MNIKPYQNNFNAYSPINYNKQTKPSEKPILNTVEDTKPLTINKVETDMDIKLVFTDTYNNKGQIAKPKGTLNVDETYLTPEKQKTEEEKFLEEVNIVNKMDKDLFTEKQIEDVKKIVSHINPNDMFSTDKTASAKVGLAVSQLKYYANNYMDEKQRGQFLEDLNKGMDLTHKEYEKSNEDYNYTLDKLHKYMQKIDPSIKDHKYIKLENYPPYKEMNIFLKVDSSDEESFNKTLDEYKNSQGIMNSYLMESFKNDIKDIQKMWDDFKHLIK